MSGALPFHCVITSKVNDAGERLEGVYMGVALIFVDGRRCAGVVSWGALLERKRLSLSLSHPLRGDAHKTLPRANNGDSSILLR